MNMKIKEPCRKIEFKLPQYKRKKIETNIKNMGALDILQHKFFPDVLVSENNFYFKIVHAVVMLKRLIDTVLGDVEVDDSDYVGNKMLISVGRFAEKFEDIIKEKNDLLVLHVKNFIEEGEKSLKQCFSIIRKLDPTQTTEMNVAFMNEIFPWNSKVICDKLGDYLERCCQPVTSPYSSMTKISMQHKESNEDLHPSEWGMFCPVGEEAEGLEKRLGPMTVVTTHEEESTIITLCRSFDVEEMSQFPLKEVHPPKSYLVTLNGRILGKHMQPELFARKMRKQRREGRVGAFVSIHVHDQHRWIYIASDGGRVCRPFGIVDEGVSKIEDHHIKELKDGARTFASFLQDGLLEYLDVNEMKNAQIALDEDNVTNKTTHIEIDPYTIFKACKGQIPYPHQESTPGITTYQEKY